MGHHSTSWSTPSASPTRTQLKGRYADVTTRDNFSQDHGHLLPIPSPEIAQRACAPLMAGGRLDPDR